MLKRLTVGSISLVFLAAPLFASADPTCPALSRALARGARGNDVVQLQQFLIAQGSLQSGLATGYFGALTEAGVKFWQSKNGVDSIGIVGPKTRAAIAKQCSVTILPTPSQTFSTSPTSGSVPFATTVSGANPFIVLKGDSVFSVANDGTFADSSGVVDAQALTKKFYSYYADQYDFVVLYTTFAHPPDHALSVNNTIKGIGNAWHDQSSLYGSSGKLKSIAVMHSIYPGIFGDLAHEISHYWLMYVQSTEALPISTDGAHWSKWIDASVWEDGILYADTNASGYTYKDNNDGTFSYDQAIGENLQQRKGVHRFSTMDLYLMGMLSPSEVKPLTLWRTNLSKPATDEKMTGTKTSVTVDDIIKLAGPRVPAYPNTPRDFKVAYILLPEKGETVSSAQIENIKWIAENFPQEWNNTTSGRSTIAAPTGNPVPRP